MLLGHAEHMGGLPLLQSEFEPAPEKMVADVSEFGRIAWNGLRGNRLPPVEWQRNPGASLPFCRVWGMTGNETDPWHRIVNAFGESFDDGHPSHWA